MGDHVECDFKIWGMITAEVMDITLQTLKGDLNCIEANIDSYADLTAIIPGVLGGDMPPSFKDYLIENKVNFSWAWAAGDGFGTGIVLHDAHLGCTYTQDTIEGDIAIRALDLGDPESVKLTIQAQQLLHLSDVVPRVVIASSHDHIQTLARNPAIASYYARTHASPERMPRNPDLDAANKCLFERYEDIIFEQMERGEDALKHDKRLSLNNLQWMCLQGQISADTLPADKLSRWIGFVQGCLSMRSVFKADEERDFSRPIFHKVYANAGIPIPEKKEKEK